MLPKYLLGPVGDMYCLSNTFRMLVENDSLNKADENTCPVFVHIKFLNLVASIINIRNISI